MQVDATTSTRRGKAIAMFTASAKAMWAAMKEGESKASIGGMVRFEDATQDDVDDAEVVTERLAAKVAESTGLTWNPRAANAIEEQLGDAVHSVLGKMFERLLARGQGEEGSKGEGKGTGVTDAAADSTASAEDPASAASPAKSDVAPVLEPLRRAADQAEEGGQPAGGGAGGGGSSSAGEASAGNAGGDITGEGGAGGAAAGAKEGEGGEGGEEVEGGALGAAGTSFEWEETPLSDWARQRLIALLKEVEVELPGVAAQVVEVDSLQGEASVSRRRGRSVLYYEIKIKGKWDAEEVDDEGEVLRTGDGEFKVLQFDHDSEPEDVKVEFTPAEDGGSVDRELCRRVKADAVEGIRAAIHRFREEIAAK